MKAFALVGEKPIESGESIIDALQQSNNLVFCERLPHVNSDQRKMDCSAMHSVNVRCLTPWYGTLWYGA